MSQLHPDVERGPSAIAGQGLFAAAALPAGAVVLRPGDLTLLNHACDPNLGWQADDIVTLREVAVGEELVVDYAMSITDPDYLLRCHCPSARCRQMVEGSDWRIPQLQQRYAGRWSREVQALLDG